MSSFSFRRDAVDSHAFKLNPGGASGMVVCRTTTRAEIGGSAVLPWGTGWACVQHST